MERKMKNLALISLIGFSLLTGEETSFQPISQLTENLPSSEEKQTQFLYLSGGVTSLCPTVSIGYQKVYGSWGSDISVSGSYLPLGGYITAFPSIHYKQLFFRTPTSYFGLKTGFYWSGSGLAHQQDFFDFGIVGGNQTQRKKGKRFLEAGICPFLYAPWRTKQFFLYPAFFISYGIML
jgi:hypothetical protein